MKYEPLHQLPLFEPESNWSPPEFLPSLARARFIAVDTETHDPHLKTLGPGGVRRDGQVAGISIATDDGFKAYLPIGHASNEGMLNKKMVCKWLRDELRRPEQIKVGANILYDLEWLATENVSISGKIYDVQYAEPLLNENRKSYSLETLGQIHLGEGKDETVLNHALAAYSKGSRTKKDTSLKKGDLWRLPPKFVGPYAEQDALVTLAIFEKQKPLLEKEELWDLFELECGLIPMLLKMRTRGVRVNLDKTEILRKELKIRRDRVTVQIKELLGKEINVWSSDDMVWAYDYLKVPYGRTPAGSPSFTQTWLQFQEDPLSKMVIQARRFDKQDNTFLSGLFKHSVTVNGVSRIHSQLHPLRSADEGTVSGRFSSTNPNLQQVPSRDEELAPLVRGMFIPEDGEDWWKVDWSQMEYRLLVHYAYETKMPGADAAWSRYRTDPRTDYHQMASELAGVKRKQAKIINFGIVYGMGIKKLCVQLGLAEDEGRRLLDQFDKMSPYARGLYELADRKAASRGYIKTLLGRKRRFDEYIPYDRWDIPLPLEEAKTKYGRVKRAGTHKALNALLQGGNADALKYCMKKIWDSGVCDVIGVPLLTVHDELDGSKPRTKEGEAAFAELVDIMTNSIVLNVPIICDAEVGESWGQIQKWKGPAEAPWVRRNKK